MRSIRQYTVYEWRVRRSAKRMTNWILWLVVMCAGQASAWAGTTSKGQAEYLVYLSGQTTFYAEQDYQLQWREGRDHWPGVEGYIMRIYYANKIILEQQVALLSPLQVTLRYPAIRPGVRVDAVLTISARAGGQTLSGIHTQNIVFYSKERPEPFTNTFQSLDIGVLDFTEQKSLVRFLGQIGVSHTELESLVGFAGRWLIVSGADFNKTYSLLDELYARWKQGTSIIVLAPISGAFRLPAHEPGERVMLADAQVIRDADRAWTLDTANPRASERNVIFRETLIGEQMGYEPSKTGAGPSWITFSQGVATLILCGWDLPALYDENPAAGLYLRHFLVQAEGETKRDVDSMENDQRIQGERGLIGKEQNE